MRKLVMMVAVSAVLCGAADGANDVRPLKVLAIGNSFSIAPCVLDFKFAK